jgi:hypothetical protein
VYGKITEINKVDSSSSVYNVGRFKKINYYYDAAGNRIGARFERYASRPTYYNWYVRDASGNVMAVYKYTDSLYLNEQHLYGSSRLGIYAPDQNLQRPLPSPTSMPLLSAGGNFATFTRAKKFFELSNHLGNVLVTIRDTKRGVDDGVYSFVKYVRIVQHHHPMILIMCVRLVILNTPRPQTRLTELWITIQPM